MLRLKRANCGGGKEESGLTSFCLSRANEGNATGGCTRRAGQLRASRAIVGGRILGVLICGEMKGEVRPSTGPSFFVIGGPASGLDCAAIRRLALPIFAAVIGSRPLRNRAASASGRRTTNCKSRLQAAGQASAAISHGLSRSEEMSKQVERESRDSWSELSDAPFIGSNTF